MSEQRGHGPTEQREWGEGWPKRVPVIYDEAVDLITVVPLAAAEAALSRVEGERDELAAHLERVREWAEAIPDEYAGDEGDQLTGLHSAAQEILSLLPDPKGEATICCCYSEECPIHGTPWRCGDCGADWGPGVLDCRYCASADPKGER